MYKKQPRLMPGEVTREFIYELVESAIIAIASSRSTSEAIYNFRAEIENRRHEIELAPDPMDE